MIKKDICGRVIFERAEGVREKVMPIFGDWGVGRSAPGREDSVCKSPEGQRGLHVPFQGLREDHRGQKGVSNRDN